MKATEILEKLQNVFLSAEAEVSEAPVEEVKEELSSEEVVENIELEAQEEVSKEVVEETRSSSYARKYALNGLFLIDDTKDADATNDHKDARKWLNKNTPEFKKAQEFMASGGTLSTIEQKYKLSTEVKQLLNK